MAWRKEKVPEKIRKNTDRSQTKKVKAKELLSKNQELLPTDRSRGQLKKSEAQVKFHETPPGALLGCPGQEVRIKGDRISGLFHPNISH